VTEHMKKARARPAHPPFANANHAPSSVAQRRGRGSSSLRVAPAATAPAVMGRDRGLHENRRVYATPRMSQVRKSSRLVRTAHQFTLPAAKAADNVGCVPPLPTQS
jgi:hypothetical protein